MKRRWPLAAALILAFASTGQALPRGQTASPEIFCTPGPYIVFFDLNSSAIKKDAIEVLDNVIEYEGNCGGAPMLAGHSDTSENPAIARDRAVAVRNYLASRGVFVKRRYLQAFGATQLRIKTPPKTEERQNRRVELIYGPTPP